jgi:endonuclease YncB( thermonuclease family)
MAEQTKDLYQDSPVETIEGKPIGAPVRILDPDTLRSGDTSYRLHGFNAPETAKLQGGIFVPNQVANDQSQRIVNRIAAESGFTDLEPVGTDPYGRVVAKQTNSIGQELGDTLTVLGLFNPGIHTDNQVVRDAAAFSAVESVFPEFGDTDPLVKAAREEKQNRIKEEGNPTYMPRMVAYDERQYAAMKNMTGITAVKEEVEEISRLQNILATEDLKPETKLKLQKQVEEAQQRLFFAATTPDMVGGVMVRHGDRSIMNQAHNQIRTTLKYASLDMLNGLGGILDMNGKEAEWDWLSRKGKDMIARTKYEQEDLAYTLSSFEDIRTNDPWSAVTDTATYVGNLAAGTLPMMGLIIGSSAGVTALGAVGAGAFALSAIPPSLMYAGQFYSSQEDDKKNAGLAMTMGFASGILDKLGLDAMGVSASPLTKAGRNLISKELIATGKAGTKEEADRMILEASKKELIEVSKVGSEFAKQQYKSSEARLRMAASLGGKIAAESSTESMQQAAQMLAESGEFNTDIQYEKDFYKSLLDAAVGGGVMGGTIAMGETSIDIATWQSAADAVAMYKKNIDDATRFNIMHIQDGNNNLPKSIQQASTQNRDKGESQRSLEELKADAPKGAWNAIKSVVTDPMSLVRKLSETAIPSITKEDGTFKTNLAYLKAIMSGSGILPGNHYAALKQRLVGQLGGNNAEELSAALGSNVYETEKLVKSAWQNVWSKGSRLEGASPQEVALQSWKDQIDDTYTTMRSLAATANVEMPELLDPDAMFTSATIHPKNLIANRTAIEELMAKNGANRRQASEAIDNIISGDRVVAESSKQFMREYGVFNDSRFNNIFESNIFTSMENIKNRIADRIADETLLGKDGQTIANLLQKAKNNGEFESNEEYLNTLKEVTDWYDIIQGKYHPLDNHPVLNKIISWGTTLTMLSSLGKAALSSIPEAAFATLGTQGKYVNTQVETAVKAFFSEYRSDINNFSSWGASILGINLARNTAHSRLKVKIDKLEVELNSLLEQGNNADPAKIKALENKVEELYKKDLGRSLFEILGYNETGYNTQAKFEINSVSNNMRKTMQVFSSAIGLRSITDSVRVAALTVASDITISKLTNLRAIPKSSREYVLSSGDGMTKSQAQDLKDLVEFGMNVPAVLKFLDFIEASFPDFGLNEVFSKDFLTDNKSPFPDIKENILTTLGNMVDSKVTHPQAHNMPKFYHDPRLRLLTVMTRFVGSFTSNILPRLYKNYLLEGNTGMRYQAFSVVVMSLLLASFANTLKDELAYGEENPYLIKTREKLQRNLYASGLLGRFETVADAIVPLYPQRTPSITQDPVGAAYSAAKNTSPVVGYVDKLLRTGQAVAEDDYQKAIKTGSRAMPLIGSFPIAGQTLSELLTNFKE